jgi:hypothetical protein
MKTQVMEGSTTNDLRHGITVIQGEEKTVIKIKLNDECKNGHEDFSMTADIYEDGRDVGGGCCHDHILKLRPDLKPFADLHLATWQGVPMYAVENGFYWFAGFVPAVGSAVEYHGGSGRDGKPQDECRRIFAEMMRATPEQVEAIVSAMPRSKDELQAVLEDLGFPAQWQSEAQAAIAQLEQWTGKTFKSEATRGHWEPLSDEKRALIAERRATGYYSPEQVAARDAEKFAKAKAAKLKDIQDGVTESTEKLRRNAQVRTYFIERYFPHFQNFIYYDHTNTVAVNWSNTEKLITRAQFDAIVAEVDATALPDGIKFEWKERPKY